MWGCPPGPLQNPPPLPPRNAPSCVAWCSQLCQPRGRRLRARLRSHVAPSRFPLAQPLGTATVPRTVSWHNLSMAVSFPPPSCHHCAEEVKSVQWAMSLISDGSAPRLLCPRAPPQRRLTQSSGRRPSLQMALHPPATTPKLMTTSQRRPPMVARRGVLGGCMCYMFCRPHVLFVHVCLCMLVRVCFACVC